MPKAESGVANCRLVPAVGLAVRRAGRARGSSSDGPLPVVPGREAGRKVSALVVGMVAGAGSIAEMGGSHQCSASGPQCCIRTNRDVDQPSVTPQSMKTNCDETHNVAPRLRLWG